MSDEAIQGLDGLLSALGSLESLVTQKQIVARSLKAGAVIIRDRAAELAPRLTGKLSKEMMVTITEQTSSSAIAKIGPSKAAGYGTPEEFGSIHNSAQPFLRPAYDEQQEAAVRLIGETIAGEIAREVKA